MLYSISVCVLLFIYVTLAYGDCPRGFTGEMCAVNIGCTLGCDNGGTCELLDTTKPQDSRCTNCFAGVVLLHADRSTSRQDGWRGTFCEISNSDGASFTVQSAIAPSLSTRRLLTSTRAIIGNTGVLSRRACDCGSNWEGNRQSTFADTSTDFSRLMLTGNYDRSTTSRSSVLLAITGFDKGDSRHRPVLWRQVGSHEQAHYLCSVDFYCSGYYSFSMNANQYAAFYTDVPQQKGPPFYTALRSLLDSSSIIVRIPVERISKRLSCSDATLNSDYYSRKYASEIIRQISGVTIGNIDVPSSTHSTVQAELHWRLFGHIRQNRPSSTCDMTILLDQDVAYCNASLVIQAFVPPSNDTHIIEYIQTTNTTKQTCTANDTVVVVSSTQLVSIALFSMDILKRNTTSPALLSTTSFHIPGCTNTSSSTQDSAILDLGYTNSIDTSCAPITLVQASHFFNQTRPSNETQTGVPNFKGTHPVCNCIMPFRSSQPDNTDCADDMCSDGHGVVNTTWFLLATPTTRASPLACICDPKWTTSKTCVGERYCDWCQESLCHPENGGIVQMNADGTSQCDCPRIFAGDQCEQNKCITANTYPFNYSFADGHTNNETGAIELRTNALCQCLPGYFGIFCEKRCIHGDYNAFSGMCICNHRQGYRGESCDEEICASGVSHYALSDAYILEQSLSYVPRLNLTISESCQNTTCSVYETQYNPSYTDTDVGTCVCVSPIFYGLECRQNKCDTNAISDVVGWNGYRPFGIPQQLTFDLTWYCKCNFPYVPDVNSTGNAMNCASDVCHYGAPSATSTNQTVASDMCTCSTAGQDIGIYTPQSLCTGRSVRECPKSCAFGHCRIDVVVFEPQPIGGPKENPCCYCTASVGFHINSTDGCTPFCSFTQPCLTTNHSGFLFNPKTNTRECSCNPNYSSVNEAGNDCSIYTPPSTMNATVPNMTSFRSVNLIVATLVPIALFFTLVIGWSLYYAGLFKRRKTLAKSDVRTRGTYQHLSVLSILLLTMGKSVYAADDNLPVAEKFNIVYGMAAPKGNYFYWRQDDCYAATTSLSPRVRPFHDPGLPGESFHLSIPSEGTGILPPDVYGSTCPLAGPSKFQCKRYVDCKDKDPNPDPNSYCNYPWAGYDQTPTTYDEVQLRLHFSGMLDWYCLTSNQKCFLPINIQPKYYEETYVLDQAECVSVGYGSSLTHASILDNTCSSHGHKLDVATNLPAYVGRLSAPFLQSLSRSCNDTKPGDRYRPNVPPNSDYHTCPINLNQIIVTQKVDSLYTDRSNYVFSGVDSFQESFEALYPLAHPRDIYQPLSFKIDYQYYRTPGRADMCECDKGWFGAQCQYRTCTYQVYSFPLPLTSVDFDKYLLGMDVPYFTNSIDAEANVDYTYYKNEQYRESDGLPAYLGTNKYGMNRGIYDPFWSGTNIHDNSPYALRYQMVKDQCSGNLNARLYGANSNANQCLDDAVLFADPLERYCLQINAGYDEACYADRHNRVNRGLCEECADGWGLFPGLYKDQLKGTFYERYGHGLCQHQTRHSSTGEPCGGYGIPQDRFTTHVTQSDGKHQLEKQGIGSCQCVAPWVVPYQSPIRGDTSHTRDSGICIRTCAAEFDIKTVTQFFVNGKFQNTTLLLSNACHGVKHGLCRPIVNDGASGLNSACMCTAGWNGYDCGARDDRFYDNGGPLDEDGTIHYYTNIQNPMASLTLNQTYTYSDYNFCGSGPYTLSTIIPLTPSEIATCVAHSTSTSQPDALCYPDVVYFNKYIVPMNIDGMQSISLFSAYMCRCNEDGIKRGYDTLNEKGTCSRGCNAHELVGIPEHIVDGMPHLQPCSGPLQGTCVSDVTTTTVAKFCQCKRGWGGTNCGIRIYRDLLGQLCGGSTRGALVFDVNTFPQQQVCLCLNGFIRDSHTGMCRINYPNGLCPSSTSDVCSGSGSCGVNGITGNDYTCSCYDGHSGDDCSIRTVPAFLGDSGSYYTCSGRGTGDVSGQCICYAGFVGDACELDTVGHPCGIGQPFRDNSLAGIIIKSSMDTSLVDTHIYVQPCGLFDPVAYAMLYVDAAFINSSIDAAEDQGSISWQQYNDTGHDAGRLLVIVTGASGLFDGNAYSTLYNLSADTDAWTHYRTIGHASNYSACVPVLAPLSVVGKWSNANYVRLYPDVASEPNPWVHFLRIGYAQGRHMTLVGGAHGLFDPILYATINSVPQFMSSWQSYNEVGHYQLADVGITLLENGRDWDNRIGHFNLTAWTQIYMPNETNATIAQQVFNNSTDKYAFILDGGGYGAFDANAYETIYADELGPHAQNTSLQSYLTFGQAAQLNATLVSYIAYGYWDSPGYIQLYPDVTIDAWTHYVLYGHVEQRHIVLTSGQHGIFASDAYLRDNPYMKSLHITDAWIAYRDWGYPKKRAAIRISDPTICETNYYGPQCKPCAAVIQSTDAPTGYWYRGVYRYYTYDFVSNPTSALSLPLTQHCDDGFYGTGALICNDNYVDGYITAVSQYAGDYYDNIPLSNRLSRFAPCGVCAPNRYGLVCESLCPIDPYYICDSLGFLGTGHVTCLGNHHGFDGKTCPYCDRGYCTSDCIPCNQDNARLGDGVFVASGHAVPVNTFTCIDPIRQPTRPNIFVNYVECTECKNGKVDLVYGSNIIPCAGCKNPLMLPPECTQLCQVNQKCDLLTGFISCVYQSMYVEDPFGNPKCTCYPDKFYTFNNVTSCGICFNNFRGPTCKEECGPLKRGTGSCDFVDGAATICLPGYFGYNCEPCAHADSNYVCHDGGTLRPPSSENDHLYGTGDITCKPNRKGLLRNPDYRKKIGPELVQINYDYDQVHHLYYRSISVQPFLTSDDGITAYIKGTIVQQYEECADCADGFYSNNTQNCVACPSYDLQNELCQDGMAGDGTITCKEGRTSSQGLRCKGCANDQPFSFCKANGLVRICDDGYSSVEGEPCHPIIHIQLSVGNAIVLGLNNFLLIERRDAFTKMVVAVPSCKINLFSFLWHTVNNSAVEASIVVENVQTGLVVEYNSTGDIQTDIHLVCSDTVVIHFGTSYLDSINGPSDRFIQLEYTCGKEDICTDIVPGTDCATCTPGSKTVGQTCKPQVNFVPISSMTYQQSVTFDNYNYVDVYETFSSPCPSVQTISFTYNSNSFYVLNPNLTPSTTMGIDNTTLVTSFVIQLGSVSSLDIFFMRNGGTLAQQIELNLVCKSCSQQGQVARNATDLCTACDPLYIAKTDPYSLDPTASVCELRSSVCVQPGFIKGHYTQPESSCVPRLTFLITNQRGLHMDDGGFKHSPYAGYPISGAADELFIRDRDCTNGKSLLHIYYDIADHSNLTGTIELDGNKPSLPLVQGINNTIDALTYLTYQNIVATSEAHFYILIHNDNFTYGHVVNVHYICGCAAVVPNTTCSTCVGRFDSIQTDGRCSPTLQFYAENRVDKIIYGYFSGYGPFIFYTDVCATQIITITLEAKYFTFNGGDGLQISLDFTIPPHSNTTISLERHLDIIRFIDIVIVSTCSVDFCPDGFINSELQCKSCDIGYMCPRGFCEKITPGTDCAVCTHPFVADASGVCTVDLQPLMIVTASGINGLHRDTRYGLRSSTNYTLFVSPCSPIQATLPVVPYYSSNSTEIVPFLNSIDYPVAYTSWNNVTTVVIFHLTCLTCPDGFVATDATSGCTTCAFGYIANGTDCINLNAVCTQTNNSSNPTNDTTSSMYTQGNTTTCTPISRFTNDTVCPLGYSGFECAPIILFNISSSLNETRDFVFDGATFEHSNVLSQLTLSNQTYTNITIVWSQPGSDYEAQVGIDYGDGHRFYSDPTKGGWREQTILLFDLVLANGFIEVTWKDRNDNIVKYLTIAFL